MTEGKSHRRNATIAVAAVIALVMLGGWVLIDKYVATERADTADVRVRSAEARQVVAEDQAQTLGARVVADVCESADPDDAARFASLCRNAAVVAARGETGATGQRGEPGKDGADGKDGETPACNALPTRCVGPMGPQGVQGIQGERGLPGIDGVTPPCMSEPAQCRGADGAPAESNPCPGVWSGPYVDLLGTSYYKCEVP
jgi:hypothetical protein